LPKALPLYLYNMEVSRQVSVQPSATPEPPPPITPVTEQQELQNLSQIIKTWRELNNETSVLKEQVREKTKRLKAIEEMILRIMKKNNIGALDLKESGGRILYRRSSSKATLNPKTLSGLLAQHLKSEQAAADAIKYITEHREAKTRESILYEKE